MAFALREYQTDLIIKARTRIRAGDKSVLMVAPTGAGKTALASFMLGNAAERGLKSVFVVHRRELVSQSSRTFDKVGIKHGIIAAGFGETRSAPVQIASIQTLAQRGLPWTPDMIIFDEAHHIASDTWDRFANQHKNATQIGLTATPCRLDGRGLGDWFDTLVEGPTTSWLIEHGFLSPYRLFAPSTPDMTGVKSRAGDWAKSEVADRMDKPSITGDAINHYQRLCNGARAIVFATNIEHSKHIAAQFEAAGYPAAHLDGKTDRGTRDQMLAEFKAGRIKIISNVDLFGEGFDVPAIEAAILLRPTQSTGLYLQQVGRALRTSEGKERAIILDHAGNALRHGLPDEIRDWNLDAKPKTKRERDADVPPLKQCDGCYAVHAPAPQCPVCGNIYEVKSREIEMRSGELIEIDRDMIALARRNEQSKAQSLDDLITLATARKYKNPWAWANHVHKARKNRYA